MKLSIKITEEDLEKGLKSSEYFNPFCRALNRELKGEKARIHKGKIRIIDTGTHLGSKSREIDVPKEIKEFLFAYDNESMFMTPFDYEIEL